MCLLLTKMGPLQADYPRMTSHFLNRFWDLCIKGLFKCACSSTCSIFCPLLASPRSSSNYKLASAFLNLISSGHPECTISLRSRWKSHICKVLWNDGSYQNLWDFFSTACCWDYFLLVFYSILFFQCQFYMSELQNNEMLPQMTAETKIWGHYNSWDN